MRVARGAWKCRLPKLSPEVSKPSNGGQNAIDSCIEREYILVHIVEWHQKYCIGWLPEYARFIETIWKQVPILSE